MPSIGIVASAIVPHIADKAAVWPGDVYPNADALMPGWVTSTTDKAVMLLYCGYYPDPAYIDLWKTPNYTMSYQGANYHWTGTCWRAGSVQTQTSMTPRWWYGSWTDISRLPIAKRVPTLNKLYTASPSTPWAAGEYAGVSGYYSTGITGPGHTIRWNGTSWELTSTSPEFTDLPWDKKLTPGCHVSVMDPNITASDATNANKLAGLGYTMNPAIAAPGFTGSAGAVSFISPTSSTFYRFYWNGSSWNTTSTNFYTYAFSTVTHAGIAALPASQRAWAVGAYTMSGGAAFYTTEGGWTIGNSATVGTEVVNCLQDGTWLVGARPGTVPPTPTKTAIVPGDNYATYQTGMPVPPSGTTSFNNSVAVWLTAWGALPTNKLTWRANPSPLKIKYVNTEVSWIGSHWVGGTLAQAKVALAPTSSPVSYTKQSAGTPAMGAVADASRVAVMDSFYSANPATAWTTDQVQWVGACLWTWNGSAWVQLHKMPTIHEAATYPCAPGDIFLDNRVTASNSTIAANLLGWGYVPVLRAAWSGRFGPVVGLVAGIYFWNPDAPGVTTGFTYYWNGTAWTAGTGASAGTLVAPGATISDAMISALPAEEQIVGISMAGYYSSTGAHWTSGQSATIAGNVVHWHGTSSYYWAPGVAP